MSKERVSELEEQVRYHSDLYYNKGEGEHPDALSDEDFDALVDELRVLAPDSSALIEIGAVPTYGRKVSHDSVMGSLEKVTTAEELLTWHAEFGGTLLMSPKIDGLAVRLNYKDGKLVEAATRGNGCLDENTELKFEDGTRVRLGDVVDFGIGGRVKCCDIETGQIEYQPITGAFDNGESEDWHEVTVEDEDGNQRRMIITGDHQVWVVDDSGLSRGSYIRVSDLTKGDEVVVT